MLRGLSVKKLDEWAKSKPIVLAIIAQQIAVSAEPCSEFLKLLKIGERIKGYHKLPSSKEWLRFYKNHRILNEYLIKTFKKFGEIAEIGTELAELLASNRKKRRQLGSAKFNKKIKEELEKLDPGEMQQLVSEIKNFWEYIYKLSLDDIKSDINNNYDDDFTKKFKDALKDYEMLFFIWVWTPCWLLYGEFPPTLLRSARLGNIESLEKLIRLDSSVIYDPKIAEFLHQAKVKKPKTTYELLVRAQLKGPKTKITLQKIKMNFAGFTSAVSSALGHRLSEPEVRSLFDAVAQDIGKGDIDTDIPDSPEAFAKAIQRERQFWSIIPQPDKK